MLYDVMMKPLEKAVLDKIRQKLIQEAEGTVLEIGFGTGVNIRYYPENILKIHGLDPKVHSEVQSKFPDIKFHEGHAEQLPFEDGSFDTVIATLTLCSVSDIQQVLAEIHRVLKPGGKYIFIEHILSHQQPYHTVLNALNPLWYTLSKSCQLNHPTDRYLEQGPFVLEKTERNAKGILYSGIGRKATDR